ncbi:hypothetical protein BAE44_0020216, partial [Dichanthelium oligosanthes]
LKAWAHLMFEYTGPTDPTRESKAVLTQSEVKARVELVLKKGVIIQGELANHPSARSLAHNPPHVSYLASLFCLPSVRVLPTSSLTPISCFCQNLHSGQCYPPLPKDEERKKVN